MNGSAHRALPSVRPEGSFTVAVAAVAAPCALNSHSLKVLRRNAFVVAPSCPFGYFKSAAETNWSKVTS